MESSQLTGDDGEGCNSSESGWTVYLASPMHDDDRKAIGNEGSNIEDGSSYNNGRSSGKEEKDDDNDNDDNHDHDSLASDASSGPAQAKVLDGKEGKGHQKNDVYLDEHGKDDEAEIHTKLSTGYNKKADKMKKGEGKPSKRGHNKRRSSSRASFFW